MKRYQRPGVLLRILLILVFLFLARISPRPHEVDRNLEQARLAQQAGETLAYARYVAQAAARLPSRADLWEIAGQAAWQARAPQAAIEYLEKAEAWGDISPESRLRLGDAYQALGNVERAIQIWQEDKTSPEAFDRIAQIHLSQRNYPAAIAALESELQLRPGDSQALYRLGLLLAAIQPEAAPLYLRRAADQNPELAVTARKVERSVHAAAEAGEPAYTYLAAGRALASIGEWELAVEAFQQATLLRPDWAEAWAFLGEARQRSPLPGHNRQQALQDLEKALALEPALITANVFMALYWRRQQRQELALEYLNKAASADPKNPVLLAEIGSFLSEMGDLATAQAFYERAISLAPNNPLYWRRLAEFSIRNEIQLRQIALPAARRAVILAPNDPNSLDVMGQALFLLGDLYNAERFLRRALQIDPNYAPAYLHLAMISLMQEQTSLALQQLRLADELAPDTPTAEQAQRLLNRYSP